MCDTCLADYLILLHGARDGCASDVFTHTTCAAVSACSRRNRLIVWQIIKWGKKKRSYTINIGKLISLTTGCLLMVLEILKIRTRIERFKIVRILIVWTDVKLVDSAITYLNNLHICEIRGYLCDK